MRVVVAWDAVANAEPLLRDVVREVTGYDPGPVHHTCPQCGSVVHGRPYVEAPVEVSIAHAPGLTVVAVSDAGPVGVDVEVDAEQAWVRKEAVGKTHGTGLLVDDPGPAWVSDLEIAGYVASLAVLKGPVEVQAAPRRTATPGTAPAPTVP
jgi:hypothetical protein